MRVQDWHEGSGFRVLGFLLEVPLAGLGFTEFRVDLHLCEGRRPQKVDFKGLGFRVASFASGEF